MACQQPSRCVSVTNAAKINNLLVSVASRQRDAQNPLHLPSVRHRKGRPDAVLHEMYLLEGAVRQRVRWDPLSTLASSSESFKEVPPRVS